ncbi:regulator [Mycobacteroides abscessus]|uniref:regulator n=1 Tax=Mycobacteroides abscessus TaxID=36809 RepID=UPI000E6818D6|nr:regulator [Mycobacteroides abscessus]RIS79110.1 regulator [Mycobacteroides abscessus]
MRGIIGQLPVPNPWNRTAFVRTVEQLRGRRITLLPVDATLLAGSACGLWLVREHDDVVLYQDGTSQLHADQIILHELGHMLLGHDKNAKTDTAQMVSALTPNLNPATVKAALGRSAYNTAAEHDAELFASLILSHSPKDRTLSDVLIGRQ